MPDDTEAQILSLRAKIAAGQRARVRAEHERDAAQAAADKAAERLREEFGVATRDEITRLIADLTAERDAELLAVREQIDEAGG